MNPISVTGIQNHVNKRRDINRKHTLLRELGFVYEGTRYKHPNGKLIMMQVYEKMNYNMLLGRLNSLGFSLTKLAN
jgi:hypothetical protein